MSVIATNCITIGPSAEISNWIIHNLKYGDYLAETSLFPLYIFLVFFAGRVMSYYYDYLIDIPQSTLNLLDKCFYYVNMHSTAFNSSPVPTNKNQTS